MTWKSILGLLIRCEISASRDCLGNVRVSAKGAIAVIMLGLLLVALAGGHPSGIRWKVVMCGVWIELWREPH